MQKKESHIIHFQEFENLERDCHRFLVSGLFPECFERLEYYIGRHNSKLGKNDLIMHKGAYSDIKRETSFDLAHEDDLERKRRKLRYALLDFIDNLKPPGISIYYQDSLRRNTKWNEEQNFIVYLQFEYGFSHFAELFDAFRKDWLSLIQTGAYLVDIEGNETFLKEDPEDEGPFLTMDNDLQDGGNAHIIKTRELLDDFSIRIKKRYVFEAITNDEFGQEVQEKIFESAKAIIEKVESRFQIMISIVGPSVAKITLANELLEWFERNELFVIKNLERFAICIPQAEGFKAMENSSTAIKISLNQAI